MISNKPNNNFSEDTSDSIYSENYGGKGLIIETDLSTLSLYFKTILIIFICISPLLLFFFFMGFFYTGIIFSVIYIIILSLYTERYFFFKKRKLRWQFDKSQQKVILQRISHKIKNMKELDFSLIESIKCYKKRNFLNIPGFNQYVVASITSNGKKHRIYFGKHEKCEKIVGIVKNYLNL